MRFFVCFISLAAMLLVHNKSGAQITPADSMEQVWRSRPDDTVKVTGLLNLAKACFANADYEKGLNYAEEAARLARKTHFQKAEALAHNIKGTILRAQGKYDESLKEHFTALKLREESGDSMGVSNSYNNIGLLYWGLEKYPMAFDYHKKALRIRARLGDSAAVASSYVNIGMTLYKQGLAAVNKNDSLSDAYLEGALDHYRNAFLVFEKMEVLQSQAACLNNMANVYADRGGFKATKDPLRSQRDYDLSLEYYFKAMVILEKAGDKQSVVITLNNISLIYREEKNYDKALEYANKSLALAKEIGAGNEMQEAYVNLADICAQQKKFDLAYEYHKLYSQTRDSLLNEESSRQLVEMQTKYETEKKDKELLKKDAETKQAAQQRNFFIIGFLLMFLLAFFILRGYRQKQKANVEITRQKHLVEEKQKEILDSIHYARRIQRTLLTSERYIQKHLQRMNKS